MIKRIDALDTLRGIAVLMVIALHCEQSAQTIQPTQHIFKFFGLLASHGDLGVQLFFIVSGYTMMLTFGDQLSKQTIFSFYLRRFFRIAPLFWLAAICYLLKDGTAARIWAPNGIGWSEILLNFSFAHWLTPQAFNSVVPGGWSIAVEVQFYLIFPFFAYLFIGSHYKSILPYVLIAVIYILGELARDHFLFDTLQKRSTENERHLIIMFFYFWLPHQLICFGFGFLLFNHIEKKHFNWGGAVLLVIPALFSIWGISVLILFCGALFVLRTQISISWLSMTGKASYSMYLLHVAVIGIVQYVGQRFFNFYAPVEINFVSVVAVSLLLSLYLTKPFIEEPSIGLGQRIARMKFANYQCNNTQRQ